MEIPRRLWRFPTGKAQEKLTERFNLTTDPEIQTWEYAIADSQRLDEFLAAYESGELSDDERFTLMETILESFRDPPDEDDIEERTPRWLHTLDLIEKNIELHIYTICYWACLKHSDAEIEDNPDFAFEAAPDMRAILNRHSEQFGYPFSESGDEDSLG